MIRRAALLANQASGWRPLQIRGSSFARLQHQSLNPAPAATCQALFHSPRPIIEWGDFRGREKQLIQTCAARSVGISDSLVSRWENHMVCLRAMDITELPHQEDAWPSEVETWEASSTLKKRRLKMNKHKYRKRRKRDRRRSK